MIDETTGAMSGQEGGSKPAPSDNSKDTEPVFLEERIIMPAPKESAPVKIPAPISTPVVPDIKPVVQPKAPQAAAPLIQEPAQQPVQQPVHESEHIDSAPVFIPTAAPTPPQQPPPTPEKETGIRESISSLLASIKLPERRDFKAKADTPQPLASHAAPIATVEPAHEFPRPEATKYTPSEHGSSAVMPLRTLKDDLQSIVRDQKISLVHAASLEEEKRHGQDRVAPEQEGIRKRKRNRVAGMIFAIILLIFLGLGALYGVFYVVQERAPHPTALPSSSLLFSEQTVAFALGTLTPSDAKAALAQLRTEGLGSLGSITRIVPTVASTTGGTAVPVDFEDFMHALGASPPDELLRAVGPDFFFGFHVVDTNAPLFVIPVTSYDHAFAGMLAWESTMNADLSPVFTSVPATIIGANGLPEQRTFEDQVLRNYDIRALLDDQGNIVLYYSFPTPQILIIAQSPYSFPEILSRLQAQRKL